jgi:RNA polymerase sigma-70 factor (ECF subfamily)
VLWSEPKCRSAVVEFVRSLVLITGTSRQPLSARRGAHARERGPCNIDDMTEGVTRETLAQEALAHAHALYAFAHYLARDGQRAEDLVQETFVRCIAGAHGFTPGTALKAWLFRVLRNAFIDQCRREANNPVRAELDVDVALELNPSREEHLRDDREVEQLRAVVASEIEAALHALPEPQRSVVLLDLEGFSESEMAEVLHCAPGTIKSRLARARAALRIELKEYAR